MAGFAAHIKLENIWAVRGGARINSGVEYLQLETPFGSLRNTSGLKIELENLGCQGGQG